MLDKSWIRRLARHIVARLLLGVAMVISVAVTAQAMTPAATHRAALDFATPVATSAWSARPVRPAPGAAVDLRNLYPIYRWITKKALV